MTKPASVDNGVRESHRPDPSYFLENNLTDLPKIHCGNHDCNNGLHCFYFYQSRMQTPAHDRGACQGCGADLVNWEYIQNCNLADVDHKFTQMKTEWVRHYYWHVPFEPEALRLAHYRGRARIEAMLRSHITRNVKALNPQWDRRNTPFKGDIIHYIRHATASCCRVCIEYWHGIPRDEARNLTSVELDYLVELGKRYLSERLPNLGSAPDRSYRATRRPSPSSNVPSFRP